MAALYQRVVAGATLLAFSAAAAAAYCPAVIDSVWEAGVQAAGAALESSLVTMSQSIANTRKFNLERVQSALRVVVKQINVSTDKLIATETGAKQGSAVYAATLSNRKAVFNTMLQYNSATGQGFDPCAELKRSQDVAVAIGEANSDMQEKVIRELDAAPGRLVASRADLIYKRINDAKKLYCTPAEAKMGLCTVAALPGADVDAGNFFANSTRGSAESNGKSALLNNMYGVPYETIPKAAADTPAGRAFLEAKRNEDAYRSVSQASLKAVQSWTESSSTDKGGSVLGALEKKIGTYSGGENYAAWEKSKTSQSERGLLVEYAKMAAAELFMLHSEYQQTERIESQIATWQAMHARAMASGSEVRVIGQSAAGKVK